MKDPNLKISQRIEPDENGDKKMSFTFKRGETPLDISAEETYDENGKLKTRKYISSKDGKTQTDIYGQDGKRKSTIKSDGKITKTTEYSDDGSVNTKFSDENGNIFKTETTSRGKISTTLGEHDQNGSLKLGIKIESDKGKVSTQTGKFDESGSLVTGNLEEKTGNSALKSVKISDSKPVSSSVLSVLTNKSPDNTKELNDAKIKASIDPSSSFTEFKTENLSSVDSELNMIPK